MAKTHTGGFDIGFRQLGSAWQGDFPSLVEWAKQNEFACIDVRPCIEAVRMALDAGLAVGSVDLPQFTGMLSAERIKRDRAVEENSQFVAEAASAGARTFFVVMLPEDSDFPRKANFESMVESYGRLIPVLAQHNARMVIEGWPGPGALCCTPETCRAFFQAIDSPAAGVNFDPSHLLRMGIDPMRFLTEFVDRVGHVHGKDTELFPNQLYKFGHEQPPTFAAGSRYGGATWRYTIPGRGGFPWSRGLAVLAEAGYSGLVSIELEDDNFNGTQEGEVEGLLLSRQYLQLC